MSHFYAEFSSFNASTKGPKRDAGAGLTFPFTTVDGATSSVMSISRQGSPEKRFNGRAGHFSRSLHPERDQLE